MTRRPDPPRNNKSSEDIMTALKALTAALAATALTITVSSAALASEPATDLPAIQTVGVDFDFGAGDVEFGVSIDEDEFDADDDDVEEFEDEEEYEHDASAGHGGHGGNGNHGGGYYHCERDFWGTSDCGPDSWRVWGPYDGQHSMERGDQIQR
jgi:hypothetical protein